MKIEKINNNQIRCTLTKQDLIDRELKISELAYGTEKAKSLFRDMIQQASYEFGFEAEDIPLMVEAIPLSDECIILTITKVENPEELDTRFSKFSSENAEDNETPETAFLKGADEILDLYKKIQEEKLRLEKQKQDDFVPLEKAIQAREQEQSKTTPETQNDKKELKKDEPMPDVPFNLAKIYKLHDLDIVCHLAAVLKDFYHGSNSLYKNPSNKKYYLLLNKDEHTPEEFNKLCNILSEYGVPEKHSDASEAYFKEHYQIIVENNAIQVLSSI